jgi:hypothetical protein
VPAPIRAGVPDEARSLLVPSQGSGWRRGRAVLHSTQQKEEEEVVMDLAS